MRLLSMLIVALCAVAPVYAMETAVSVKDAIYFRYHARFALQGKAPHDISLRWYDGDMPVTVAATVDGDIGDPLYAAGVSYVVTADTCVSSGRVDCPFDGTGMFSVILNHAAGGTSMELGSAHAAAEIAVPFDSDTIYVCTGRGSELQRHTLIARHAEDVGPAAFADAADVRRHIAGSTDAMEAVWTYFDRDIDPAHARLPQRYTIATVADGNDGEYTILLLNDDSVSVKGWLKPTPFVDHYNLGWLDADGRYADSEANATLEVEGTLLKLSFPLLKSSVRFRRETPLLQ